MGRFRHEALLCTSEENAVEFIRVHEAMSNGVRHGGGGGSLAGRVRPAPTALGERGLWLLSNLCDLVQLRTLPDGNVLRLHMSLA